MLLRNRFEHMKGKGVLVNGHLYKIGQDGVPCDDAGKHLDVPEADAKKLLGNRDAWSLYDPSKASQVAAVAAPEKPRLQLVTNAGEVIPPPPPPFVPGPELAPTPPTTPVMAPAVVDPPIPTGKQEWADPKPEYSLEWLQACAKAYKVKVKGKDKVALVKTIKAAMYE